MRTVRFEDVEVGMRTPLGLVVTEVEVDEETGRYEVVFDRGAESCSGSYDTLLTVEEES